MTGGARRIGAAISRRFAAAGWHVVIHCNRSLAAGEALAATIPMLAMAAAPEDRIYGLAPGAILASHEQSEADAEATHRFNLLGRRTTADEVAEGAWFLATGPLASGQTLFIDSGQHLLAQPRDVMYLAPGRELAR